MIFLFFISLNSLGQSPLSTVGTDFWMGFMTNRGFQNDPQCQLIITSETATTGLVEMPLQSWSQSFTGTPGAATIVIMPHFNNAPQSSAEHLSSGVIESLGVHITAVDSVSVFAGNYGSTSEDIMKVLPVQSLETEYIVSSFPGLGHSFASEALIVATEDNTEIEIISTVNTIGGPVGGVPTVINLNQGESYQFQASGNNASLSGTRITGTSASGSCRPFAVFGGVECAEIPITSPTCGACDHVCDQVPPLSNWGNEYYTVPPDISLGITSYVYTVIAEQNGTIVTINNGTPFTLNAGQSQIFENASSADRILANAPILYALIGILLSREKAHAQALKLKLHFGFLMLKFD